jgi:hypothetical protein
MFAMCSKIGSCLILLICVGLFPALTSCGNHDADWGGDDNQLQMSPNSAATPVAVSNAAAERAAPVTDSLHFDLHCELHGRIVSDAHPELSHGTYPANELTWRDHPHYIVDLRTMQICDPGECQDYGPRRIVSATADRITVHDAPGLTIYIRRRDWRYEQRQEDMGRVSVTRGQCRRGAFSGFPPGPAQPRPAG